ncbi:hypothetical protein HMI54_005491 [Coelomomyces lativittatus]|nr:hypothetical protein HMI54_005491 [Coelomomyces lativittatus]
MPSSPKSTFSSYPFQSPSSSSSSTTTFKTAKKSISNFFMDILNENEWEGGTTYPSSNGKDGYTPISKNSFLPNTPPPPTPSDSLRVPSFYSSNHLSLSRAENLRGLANRILFSKFYKFFYFSMTLLAFLTIVLSFYQTCPTPLFMSLEIIVNATLVLEVAIRFMGTRRHFWKSKANVIDAIMVVLCLVLLFILFRDSLSCTGSLDSGSKEREEVMLDSVLLILRNALQFFRIVTMLRK